MIATQTTAVGALHALRNGLKVRARNWAEGRYIEIVADRLEEDGKPVMVERQAQVLRELIMLDGWEILEYA